MLPTIPNLPTDNLYKFMALSGIIILIFCASFIGINSTKAKNLLAGMEAETRYIEVLTELMESDSDLVEKDALKLELLSKRIESQKASGRKLEEAKALIENINSHKRLLEIAGGFGGTLIFFGFYLWYYRVQKPLDKIVQINLRKAIIESQNLQIHDPTPR